MRFRPLLLSVVAAALATLGPGCGSSSSSSERKVGPFEPKVGWVHLTCNPLVPSQCGFPFPSNVWTVDAADTPTKRRVQIDDESIPAALNGQKSVGAPWSKSDGFGAGTGILTQLPGATLEGLPSLETLARSLEADSPTVLLDAETGERIPHFAELDKSTLVPGERGRSSSVPSVALEDAQRYIVAIRKVRASRASSLRRPHSGRSVTGRFERDRPSTRAAASTRTSSSASAARACPASPSSSRGTSRPRAAKT